MTKLSLTTPTLITIYMKSIITVIMTNFIPLLTFHKIVYFSIIESLKYIVKSDYTQINIGK